MKDIKYNVGDLLIERTFNEIVTGLIINISKTEQGDRLTVEWTSSAYDIRRVWEYAMSDLERKIKLNNAEYFPVKE